MEEKHYLSSEKKKELEAELLELQGPKRKAILDSLAFAKSLGDLSENAEYHNAREEQARLEERIFQIETILRNSTVVTSHQKNEVSVGSHVKVKRQGEKEDKEFIIVGSEEADMANGKVSHNSPIGDALIGKKVGDSISVVTPKGEVAYTVTEIK